MGVQLCPQPEYGSSRKPMFRRDSTVFQNQKMLLDITGFSTAVNRLIVCVFFLTSSWRFFQEGGDGHDTAGTLLVAVITVLVFRTKNKRSTTQQ